MHAPLNVEDGSARWIERDAWLAPEQLDNYTVEGYQFAIQTTSEVVLRLFERRARVRVLCYARQRTECPNRSLLCVAHTHTLSVCLSVCADISYYSGHGQRRCRHGDCVGVLAGSGAQHC